ncbi:hypothetical protein BHM03_00062784 [Ensete ventricosum]|nr:hypothetical protein BHM03_00062784 [Ensete ventricosum]
MWSDLHAQNQLSRMQSSGRTGADCSAREVTIVRGASSSALGFCPCCSVTPTRGRLALPVPSESSWLQIREKGLLKTPNPIKTRAEECDRGCYCRFHRDYRHDTEECYDVKNQIEDLICRGQLHRFMRKPQEPSLHLKGPVERQIEIIVCSPTVGVDSSSTRKTYARVEV